MMRTRSCPTSARGLLPGVWLFVSLAALHGLAGKPAPALAAGGPLSFQAAGTYPIAAPRELVSADFNGDGRDDLLTLSRNSAVVLLARPDGTFDPPVSSPIADRSVDVGMPLIFDANGDLRPDLAVSEMDLFRVVVCLNAGNGKLGTPLVCAIPCRPDNLASLDVDEDGKPDLLARCTDTGGIFEFTHLPFGYGFTSRLARGVGPGPGRMAAVPGKNYVWNYGLAVTYSGKEYFDLPGSDPYTPGTIWGDVISGDFSGHGPVDFAIAVPRQREIAVFTRTAPATYPISSHPGVSGTPGRLTHRDLDADGDGDLVVSLPDTKLFQALLRTAPGVFVPGPTMPCPGQGEGSIAAGDFNGDGLADVAVLQEKSQQVAVFLNSTPVAAPGAPAGLVATPVSGTRVDLTWQDRSGSEEGFTIERRTGSGSFAPIATLPANATAYQDTTATPLTTFGYRVQAFNVIGLSGYSNEAATTTPALVLPAAPSNLKLEILSQSILRVRWTDNSDDETGFRVERKLGLPSEAGGYTTAGSVGANVAAFMDLNLAAGTTYTYQVRAVITGGESLPSAPATAQTFSSTPTAPANLAAGPSSSTEILLTWSDTSSTEEAFVIQRKTASGGFVQVGVAGQNATAYLDGGLSPVAQYTYRIYATNAGGDSEFAGPASATTYPVPPSPPSGLQASPVSQSSVQLSWRDNSPNETGFSLERRPAAIPVEFALIRTVGPDVTTVIDGGLQPNTAYRYRVRAVGLGGESEPSEEVTARSLPNPPAAPTDLAATPVSGTEVVLTWQHQGDTETGFTIERKGIGAYAPAGTTGPDATSFHDTGLSPQSQYTYRVRAKNDGGESAPSNEVAVTTLGPAPQPPGSLQATVRLPNTVELTWKDLSRDETGFKIERKAGSDAFAVLTTVGAGVTRHLDTGLAVGATYVYRVRAVSANGDSAPSNEATAVVPAAGGKLVVDARLDFGSVRVRTRKEKGLKVRNAGSSPLQVTVEVPGAPFGLKGGRQAFTLAAGASRSVTVTFQPAKRGRAKGSLPVSSTDPARPAAQVALTGTGT